MEPNRYNQNRHNRRDFKPYSQRPYRNHRGPRRHYDSGPSRNNYWQKYDDGPFQNNWQNYNSERTFDNRGREVSDNYRPEFDGPCVSEEVVPKLSPLEEKAKNFLHTVLNQEGIRSKLIFMEAVDNAVQTLQGTVDYYKLIMQIKEEVPGQFTLTIDKEGLAKGTFTNKQEAKQSLAKQALDLLKNDCFYIIKKNEFEEVSAKTQDMEETQPSTSYTGSKAHQMMLKMGWGGKGLGLNEQGQEKTVAETINQNISRQGLGTDDVFKKIQKILEDYSKSDKMSLLKFDPDFTSEERAHIHSIANRFGLKSKSEGKGEQRRITVTKKLNRADLVYNLLTCGLENSLYKLVIPKKFEYLWVDEDEDEEEDGAGYQPSFAS